MGHDLWNRFSSIHHQVQVDSRVSKLLERGVTGINQLKKISTLSWKYHAPIEYGQFFLPWYGDTLVGSDVKLSGSWWSGGSPLTVKEWNTCDSAVEKNHNETVRKLSGLSKAQLSELGESLVVFDSMLGVYVVVDGCKRACAAYRAGYEHLFMLLSSKWAHMLYPADFFWHVISFNDRTLS
jgi:hypothetical protein